MPNTKLIELRRERGLTQQTLADKAGVHPATLGRIERGENQARARTRRLICKALRWPYLRHDELFGPMAKPGRPPSRPSDD